MSSDQRADISLPPALRRKRYVYCFVPKCVSSSKATPEKNFFHVPQTGEIRQKWFEMCNREPGSTSTVFFCCEDHFDLERDASNFMQHKLTGCFLRLKPGTLPSNFDCQLQPDRKNRGKFVGKRTIIYRKNLEASNSCMRDNIEDLRAMEENLPFLKGMPKEFNLVLDNGNKANNRICIRSSMKNEVEVKRFMDVFQLITGTQWITYRSLPEPERCVFHKKWVCKHHNRNKRNGSVRNLDCQAYIDIRIKIINKNTKSKDVYLTKQPPLCTVVLMNLEHSHPIRAADGFSLRRVKDKTPDISQSNASPGDSILETSSVILVDKIKEEPLFEDAEEILGTSWTGWNDTPEPSTSRGELSPSKKRRKMVDERGNALKKTTSYLNESADEERELTTDDYFTNYVNATLKSFKNIKHKEQCKAAISNILTEYLFKEE